MNTDLSPVLGNQLSRFDLSSLDAQTPVFGAVSFKDLVFDAVNGNLDLSMQGISDLAVRLFWNELSGNIYLLRQLLLIALLSALLKYLTEGFNNKDTSEMSFFACYAVMITVALSTFMASAGVLTDLVTTLGGMMEASIPLIMSLTALSGNVTGAAMFHPLMLYAVFIITKFIIAVFIPLIIASAALSIIDHLVVGKLLSRWALLLKKAAELTMRAIIFLFMLLLTLQKISAPILDNFITKTAKAATGAIPVVGGVLGSAMDAVLAFSEAAKSGVLVALVIVICLAVAFPLLKILSVVLVYKVCAATIQPISDERISASLDGLGAYTGMLLQAGVMVAVMFIFAVILLLSF